MILDTIVEDKKKRLVEHKARIDEATMKSLALDKLNEEKLAGRTGDTDGRCSFKNALSKDGLSIIGEFKKASPSLGVIKNTIELEDRIEQYNNAVDAISCLTEEDHFNGNVEYFKKIRQITNLPMIRKDFIIDEYQVYEAKVIGADAILLIAAILDDAQFKKLYDLAYSLGLDVLCEVHDEEELNRMLKLDVEIVGINNRNLKDFTITLETTKRLSKMIPQNKVLVSESGVTTDDDIRTLKESGINAMLIGRAFMESEKPEELGKHWKDIYKD